MDANLFKAHRLELIALMFEHVAQTSDKKPEELIALRYQEIDALIYKLKQQRRALDYAVGVPIQPETHYGGAVLKTTFGGGM